MKSIIYLFILFIVYSCIESKEKLPSKFCKQFKHYELNDTIFFISNRNDLDTIVIKNIDSTIAKHNGFTTLPYKKKVLKVEYLPNNKWFDGLILSKKTNKFDSIKNHSFIWLFEEIEIKNSSFEMGINYRDFEGNINSEKLESFGVDTVMNSNYLRDSLNVDSVIEIYWSNENGLIGYKKKDGQVYTSRSPKSSK